MKVRHHCVVSDVRAGDNHRAGLVFDNLARHQETPNKLCYVYGFLSHEHRSLGEIRRARLFW